MSAFTPDLTPIFEGEFSETCVVAGQNVVGIFQDPFSSIEEIEGSRPEFSTKTASLPGGVEDGTTVVRSATAVSYQVIGVRPSGRGTTTLVLHEV